MVSNRKRCGNGRTALAFSAGMLVSLLFPQRCLLMIAAVIIIVLAIALSKCC